MQFARYSFHCSFSDKSFPEKTNCCVITVMGEVLTRQNNMALVTYMYKRQQPPMKPIFVHRVPMFICSLSEANI